MCIFAIYIYFSKKWEGHSEVHLTDAHYSFVGFGFLTQELVAREAEYYEVIMWICIPEGFQLLELRSKPTFGSSIDDKNHFASIFWEWYLFTVGFTDIDVVDGESHGK